MKRNKAAFVLLILANFLAWDAYAGNPAPLFQEPVHLGDANPQYGKKKKQPEVEKGGQTQTVSNNTITGETTTTNTGPEATATTTVTTTTTPTTTTTTTPSTTSTTPTSQPAGTGTTQPSGDYSF